MICRYKESHFFVCVRVWLCVFVFVGRRRAAGTVLSTKVLLSNLGLHGALVFHATLLEGNKQEQECVKKYTGLVVTTKPRAQKTIVLVFKNKHTMASLHTQPAQHMRVIGDRCRTQFHGKHARVEDACAAVVSAGRVEGCFDAKQDETKDLATVNGCDGEVEIVSPPPQQEAFMQFNASSQTWVARPIPAGSTPVRTLIHRMVDDSPGNNETRLVGSLIPRLYQLLDLQFVNGTVGAAPVVATSVTVPSLATPLVSISGATQNGILIGPTADVCLTVTADIPIVGLPLFDDFGVEANALVLLDGTTVLATAGAPQLAANAGIYLTLRATVNVAANTTLNLAMLQTIYAKFGPSPSVRYRGEFVATGSVAVPRFAIAHVTIDAQACVPTV